MVYRIPYMPNTAHRLHCLYPPISIYITHFILLLLFIHCFFFFVFFLSLCCFCWAVASSGLRFNICLRNSNIVISVIISVCEQCLTAKILFANVSHLRYGECVLCMWQMHTNRIRVPCAFILRCWLIIFIIQFKHESNGIRSKRILRTANIVIRWERLSSEKRRIVSDQFGMWTHWSVDICFPLISTWWHHAILAWSLAHLVQFVASFEKCFASVFKSAAGVRPVAQLTAEQEFSIG